MKRSKFKLSPEAWELFGELMIKIVGETVKDKILRAILIGLIAAGTSVVSIDEEPSQPAVVQQKAP
jgi:hypothetical protein